jgi:hypothetical protein
MKKILALTLVLVLVLAAFVGCKKTDATDKNGDTAAQKTTEAPLSEGIVGWYKAETVNGMSFAEWVASMFGGLAGEDETAPTMSEEELKEKLSSLGIDLDNFMSIELLEDGTAVMSSMGIAAKGTWTQDGENVTVTTKDGTEQTGTFDGSRLTLKASSEQMETTVVFVKAQKPAEPEVDPELLNNDPNNMGVDILEATTNYSKKGLATDAFPEGATEWTLVEDHEITEIKRNMRSGSVIFYYRGNPQGIEDIEDGKAAQKILRDGKVVILRGGVEYDLNGRKL